jgi:hypothetical protein
MTETFEDLEIREARIVDLTVVLSILEQAARRLRLGESISGSTAWRRIMR